MVGTVRFGTKCQLRIIYPVFYFIQIPDLQGGLEANRRRHSRGRPVVSLRQVKKEYVMLQYGTVRYGTVRYGTVRYVTVR